MTKDKPREETGKHRFGSSAPLTIGVEEELLLVDESLGLVPAAEQVIEALGPTADGNVSTEIFAAQIELKTSVCAGAQAALTELRGLRRVIGEKGFSLLGAGLHPDDEEEGDPDLVDKPRYDPVRQDLASLLRTPPCGLHVHVGMPDAETAVRVANALRRHLPVLQALTANSPFRQGEDPGLASARAAVVAAYPRFEMPREFHDYEDFLSIADQAVAAAGVDDYTYLWWNVRPHPSLGTVEIRALDVPTDVTISGGVAAIVQALAAREMDRGPAAGELSREALEESYFQASSHGLAAELLLTGEGETETAAAAARRVIDELRPYARRLGGEELLEPVEQALEEGNGADVQRRVHAERGMDGLLADLARRTAA